MSRLSRVRLAAAVAVLCAAPSSAGADTPPPAPAEPAAKANLLWLGLQAIPSSEVVIWDGKVRYGARWQITPLLYSFGVNRKLSPWRGFVVEPIVRQSGSMELYFAPEVLTGGFANEADRWILRFGLRSYVPLLHRGEYLSASFGASVFSAKSQAGVGGDVGLHTFGGLFGLRLGHSPTPGLRMTTITFELRVF